VLVLAMRIAPRLCLEFSSVLATELGDGVGGLSAINAQNYTPSEVCNDESDDKHD